MDFDVAREKGLIQKFNPLPAYFDHLRTLINCDVIAENPQHFVVDSMYGSGRGVIKSFLQGTGCEIAEIRGEMNPGFGNIHPEPIAKYLGALAGAIGSGMGNFGVTTDGDADRIGAMDEHSAFVDPHKIMALALQYLVEKRGWNGAVVRTVSTTRMIDRLCRRYGLELFETPVGFNHIADHMMTQDVLIGGEESGGISLKGISLKAMARSWDYYWLKSSRRRTNPCTTWWKNYWQMSDRPSTNALTCACTIR